MIPVVIWLVLSPGGGGGYSGYILVGVCPGTPKKGVLCAGTAQKGGLRTDLARSCSKGGIGSLFMYYLYFYLTIWSTSGGVFWQAEKGGVLGAGTARKRGVLGAGPTRNRGVLGAGQVKKGGSLPRHIPMLNIYVSTPPGFSVIQSNYDTDMPVPFPKLWPENQTVWYYCEPHCSELGSVSGANITQQWTNTNRWRYNMI